MNTLNISSLLTLVNITPICRQEIVYRINLCFLSTSKRPSLSLYLDTPFREEVTDYCFILKVTRIFPYSYLGKLDQRMVNIFPMIKINPTCKRVLILYVRKETETWLASPVSN